MAAPIDIEALLASYRAYLLARVQEQEFQSWGGSISQTFRQRIAQHQAMENTYLEEERRRRKG